MLKDEINWFKALTKMKMVVSSSLHLLLEEKQLKPTELDQVLGNGHINT